MGIFEKMEQKRRMIRRAQRIDQAKLAAGGLFIGALGALLFAPKSGKETREDIVNAANQVQEALKESSKEARIKGEKILSEKKEQLQESKEKVMKYVNEKKQVLIEKGQDILDEANKGIEEAQEALEEAEDK